MIRSLESACPVSVPMGCAVGKMKSPVLRLFKPIFPNFRSHCVPSTVQFSVAAACIASVRSRCLRSCRRSLDSPRRGGDDSIVRPAAPGSTRGEDVSFEVFGRGLKNPCEKAMDDEAFMPGQEGVHVVLDDNIDSMLEAAEAALVNAGRRGKDAEVGEVLSVSPWRDGIVSSERMMYSVRIEFEILGGGFAVCHAAMDSDRQVVIKELFIDGMDVATKGGYLRS